MCLTEETERRYGVREEGHKRNVKTLEEKKYTGSRKKDSLTEVYNCAIADHATKGNNTTDLEGVKFPTRERHCFGLPKG